MHRRITVPAVTVACFPAAVNYDHKKALTGCLLTVQGVPADVASKLPEQEVVSRTLAQLDRMFGEAMTCADGHA